MRCVLLRGDGTIIKSSNINNGYFTRCLISSSIAFIAQFSLKDSTYYEMGMSSSGNTYYNYSSNTNPSTMSLMLLSNY